VRRILITGSRYWRDEKLIESAINGWCTETATPPSDVRIVHGAALGADRLADWVARDRGLAVEPHPADWSNDGRAAGPIRNARMVALGADVCLTFALPGSRGTFDCAAKARAAGIPVIDFGEPTGGDRG
jgi:hypothetical protein